MLKFLLAGLYAVISIILCIPRHWHFASLAKKNKNKSWIESGHFVRSFFKGLLFICGTKIEVNDLDNIPDEPALFVGNHRSYFDIIILQSILSRPIGFVAKQEFKKVPLFHNYMTDIGCVYLDRKNIREGMKAINLATDHMKDGLSMCLFPEGTRNHGEGLLPFKTGGYRIAERAGRPIVLVSMTNTGKILEENGHCIIKRAHVVIHFSKPFYPHSMSHDDKKIFYNSIPDKITEMLASGQESE